MKTQFFEIDLQQPVIISQQVATVGVHQSLDYISGSALLGLAATRLYNRLSAEDAFMLFHSGKVRFLDALPSQNGEMAYPVPFALHHYKGESYSVNQQMLNDTVFNLASNFATDKTKQPVQLRNFYLTASGRRITPQKEQTLKTAIDASQNRAAKAQLFGYEALSAGQKFRFAVQADNDVGDALWQELLNSLTGLAHLGRSRSAQFGKVKICQLPTAEMPSQDSQNDTLLLWLVSDMQLQQQGQATLLPEPKCLGLPEGTIWKKDKSFIRHRRYSMFNAYRKHYDKEKQVICRGSVLSYQLPASMTAQDKQQLFKKLQAGIGLGCECGLGQVLINPTVLYAEHPKWQALTKIEQPQKIAKQPVYSVLTQVLQHRLQQATGDLLATQEAYRIFEQLCHKFAIARQFYALSNGQGFADGEYPSRSQFGSLKDLANQYRNNPTGLWQALSNTENGALHISTVGSNDNPQSARKYNSSGWGLSYGTATNETLGDWLKSELDKEQSRGDFAQIVAQIAVLGLSDKWEQYNTGKLAIREEVQS